LLANPLEDVEAIFFGYVDIQQDERRKRVPRAIRKGTFASEVVDRLLAVWHGFKDDGQASDLECALKKEDVVSLVFRVENYGRRRHGNGFMD